MLDSGESTFAGGARLIVSFVKLVSKASEYGPEEWRRFTQLTEGKKLVANIDQKEGNTLHLRLIDPTDPNAADDPLACLNADLVREGELVLAMPSARADWTGYATFDKTCRYAGAYPQIVKKIEAGKCFHVRDGRSSWYSD